MKVPRPDFDPKKGVAQIGTPEDGAYILNPFPGKQALTVAEALQAISDLSSRLLADTTLRGASDDEIARVFNVLRRRRRKS